MGTPEAPRCGEHPSSRGHRYCVIFDHVTIAVLQNGLQLFPSEGFSRFAPIPKFIDNCRVCVRFDTGNGLGANGVGEYNGAIFEIHLSEQKKLALDSRARLEERNFVCPPVCNGEFAGKIRTDRMGGHTVWR